MFCGPSTVHKTNCFPNTLAEVSYHTTTHMYPLKLVDLDVSNNYFVRNHLAAIDATQRGGL